MSIFIAKNRTAVTAIAAMFLAAGVVAAVMAIANPTFVASFSANAADVVTGQTPAVSLVVESAETKVGVFNN